MIEPAARDPGSYRLVMNNDSGASHPFHLHRHSFELANIGEKSTSGVMKDTVGKLSHSTAEIDFVANNLGDTLLNRMSD